MTPALPAAPAIATPCVVEPEAFDIDPSNGTVEERRRMRARAVSLCHSCEALDWCNEFVDALGEENLPTHGVMAGRYRPWPDDRLDEKRNQDRRQTRMRHLNPQTGREDAQTQAQDVTVTADRLGPADL